MREIAVIEQLFDTLTDLTDQQRLLIKNRYRFLMTQYHCRSCMYSLMFYAFRLTVTLGSLSVPALLTIQNTPGASQVMYWFTWALSLAVTMANGLMLLFKLDKRFFMMHTFIERLRSETWQYIELSGRYSGHHTPNKEKPTHANQFVYYCTHLERINMKWVDEEYIKTGEDKVTTAPQQQSGETKEMLVPSPPEQIEMVISEREQKERSERIISDIELEGYETDHTKSHKKIQKPTRVEEAGPKKKSVSMYQGSPTVSESTVEGDTILQITPDL
jgi:hypothetical protein